jgi:hypothetical protein
MKTIVLIIVFCISLCHIFISCNSRIASESPAIKINKPDTVRFAMKVQPILEKNCSPCHFTGGKMYASMPFDAASTILSHESGVMKRFKGEELEVIKKYLEENRD